jgi:hypothetical protein
MKNIVLKPLDKRVIQEYGIEDPNKGLKSVPGAKTFFGKYGRGSQFARNTLVPAAEKLLPDWFLDEDGNPITLTTSEVVNRLNYGGGNKEFGEPRLQLYYHAPTRQHMVIDAVEMIDQINISESMAKAGQRKQAQLEYTLQIATNQMKTELSTETQEQLLQAYRDEVEGVKLATVWADRGTRTLKGAVQSVLGDVNGDNGPKLLNKK